MYYRVNFNPNTFEVRLESGSGAAPAAIGGAYQNLGTFQHTPDNNADGYDANKVLFHFVRDILLKEKGIQNMQAITINEDILRTLSVGSAAVNVAVAATSQIVVNATPANADKSATFASSDPTKATVSDSGLITGVAAGSATITVTSKVDPTKTATVAVTVTA